MDALDQMIIATGYKGKLSVEVFGDIACPGVGPNAHGTYLGGILVYNVNVSGLPFRRTVEYSDCSVMRVCPTDPGDFSQRHRIVVTTRNPTNSPEVIERADPHATGLLLTNRPYSPRIDALELTRMFISGPWEYGKFRRTQEPPVVAPVVAPPAVAPVIQPAPVVAPQVVAPPVVGPVVQPVQAPAAIGSGDIIRTLFEEERTTMNFIYDRLDPLDQLLKVRHTGVIVIDTGFRYDTVRR